MILDAHVHLGEDVVFDEVNTEDELIRYYDEFQIDGELSSRLFPPIYQRPSGNTQPYCKNSAKNSGP